MGNWGHWQREGHNRGGMGFGTFVPDITVLGTTSQINKKKNRVDQNCFFHHKEMTFCLNSS